MRGLFGREKTDLYNEMEEELTSPIEIEDNLDETEEDDEFQILEDEDINLEDFATDFAPMTGSYVDEEIEEVTDEEEKEDLEIEDFSIQDVEEKECIPLWENERNERMPSNETKKSIEVPVFEEDENNKKNDTEQTENSIKTPPLFMKNRQLKEHTTDKVEKIREVENLESIYESCKNELQAAMQKTKNSISHMSSQELLNVIELRYAQDDADEEREYICNIAKNEILRRLTGINSTFQCS